MREWFETGGERERERERDFCCCVDFLGESVAGDRSVLCEYVSTQKAVVRIYIALCALRFATVRWYQARFERFLRDRVDARKLETWHPNDAMSLWRCIERPAKLRPFSVSVSVFRDFIQRRPFSKFWILLNGS